MIDVPVFDPDTGHIKIVKLPEVIDNILVGYNEVLVDEDGNVLEG